jgi:hypothetical protein
MLRRLLKAEAANARRPLARRHEAHPDHQGFVASLRETGAVAQSERGLAARLYKKLKEIGFDHAADVRAARYAKLGIDASDFTLRR